jgi:ATP-dependent DNA helicase RecG
VLEKIGSERLSSFSTVDLIVIQTVFDGRKIPEQFASNAKRLYEEGILEKYSQGKRRSWILSRKMYAAVSKKGVYTRKKGLDRSTNKALLLEHIKTNRHEGSRMKEFSDILPFLDRGNIQMLLRELRKEGLIHHHGNTSAGRWYPGKQTPECDHKNKDDN